MKTKKTVFVDCNDTLIAVRHANRGEEAPAGFKAIERDGQYFHVMARPSAAPFLSALAQDDCEIVVLTGGSTRIQGLLLNLARLGRLVTDIIGYDLRGAAEVPENWVLVDDLQNGSISFEEKLSMLGITRKTVGETKYVQVVKQHCVQCVAFKGGEDKDPLSGLLDTVREKLGNTYQTK
jgi:hypothetical protein